MPSCPRRRLPPAFLAGGTWDHPLGTDKRGQDVLTELVTSGRVTILIGLVIGSGEDNTALAIAMGVTIAVLAAIDIAMVMWLEGRSTRRS